MLNNLADKWHDEQGRPLPPAAPEPSKTSRETLQAWQRATLARAAARQERRAAYKELGPLHAQPAKTKADRRAQLGTALGVANQPEPETRQSINTAFPLTPPASAAATEQPPAAPIGAAKSPNQRPAAAQTAPPAVEPDTYEIDSKGPNHISPEVRARHANPKRWTAIGEHRHNQLVAAHDQACAAADRAMAEQAVKATLARHATLTPVDPPPTQPDPSAETTASADRAVRRRAASLKSAATVRARRQQREHDAEVNRLMEKSLDRIGERVIREQEAANQEAATKAANPDVHTPRELLAYARASNVEPDLYRLAHIARQSQQPSQWSPAFRRAVVNDLNQIIISRTTTPKRTQQ